MRSLDALPLLLTVKDLCKLLRLPRSSLYQLRANGTLPEPIRLGPNRVRWRATDIMHLLDALAVSSDTDDQAPAVGAN